MKACEGCQRKSESIVGVDAEAEDGSHFFWLVVLHRWLKFPAAERGDNLGGHGRRARFQYAKVGEIAGGIDGAAQDHAGPRQTFRKIAAQDGWGSESGCKGATAGVLVRKFHYDVAKRCVDVGGIDRAMEELLVRLEGTAGICCGNDCHAQGLLMLTEIGPSCGIGGTVGAVGSEAWQGNNPASAADIDAADRRRT